MPPSRWRSVLALTITSSLTSGAGFYGVSLYMATLVSTNAFPAAALSIATGLFFLASGVSGMFVGRWMVHHDVRPMMFVGALGVGASLVMIGQVNALWQIILVYLLLGVAYAAVALVPMTTLLSRLFAGKHLSLALSIAMSGLSFGGILVLPLIERIIVTIGLEQGMILVGTGCALALMLALGLLYGTGTTHASLEQGQPLHARGIGYANALRSRMFLLTALAFFLIFGSQVGAVAHLYNRSLNLLDTPSIAISVLAVISLGFRFLGGFLSSRMPLKAFTSVWVLAQALGLLIIGLATGPLTLLLGAALLGAALGNTWLVQPLLLTSFGMRDYSRIYAASQFVSMIGIALGPAVLGLLYVKFGYAHAFAFACLASGVALIAVLASGRAPEKNPSPPAY